MKDINHYEKLRIRIDNDEQSEKNHRCYLCGAEGANFFHYENGNIIVKCLSCIEKENNDRLQSMKNPKILEYKNILNKTVKNE